MLIHVPMEFGGDTENPLWANVTPGEEAHFNPEYDQLARTFAQLNGIDYHGRFMKIRIVREAGEFRIPDAWWAEPNWQDKLFWAYQTPVKGYHKDNPDTPILFYALEPEECSRVRLYEKSRSGHHRFAHADSLIVPCDCCEQAWDETSAGTSDHLLPRPELGEVKDPLVQEIESPHLKVVDRIQNLKSDEDRQEEAASEERVKEISKQIQDVTDDPRWNKEWS